MKTGRPKTWIATAVRSIRIPDVFWQKLGDNKSDYINAAIKAALIRDGKLKVVDPTEHRRDTAMIVDAILGSINSGSVDPGLVMDRESLQRMDTTELTDLYDKIKAKADLKP